MKVSAAKLLFSLFVLAFALASPAEASCMSSCSNECYSQNCLPDDQMCGQWCQEICLCECGWTC